MPVEPVPSIAIEFDALRRLLGAAKLARFSDPEAAEHAAEGDLAPWRTGADRHPRQVELTVEAAQQISAAAMRGLTAVGEGERAWPTRDQAWKTLVVSDLRHLAEACLHHHPI